MRPFDERMKTLVMALNRDPSIIGFLVSSYYIDTYRPKLLRGRERLVAAILAVIAMQRLMFKGNTYGTLEVELD